MYARTGAITASITALLLSTHAIAADDPFSFKDPLASSKDLGASTYYFGGALTSTQMSDFCDDSPSCSDDDMGWQLFGGYRIKEDLAAEAQYIYAGDVQNETKNSRSEVSGFGIHGVKTIQLSNELRVYGKGGMFHWMADNSDGSRSGTDLTFGVGGTYKIKENLSIRAEWQRAMDVETSLSTSSDIDLMTLGIQMDMN